MAQETHSTGRVVTIQGLCHKAAQRITLLAAKPVRNSNNPQVCWQMKAFQKIPRHNQFGRGAGSSSLSMMNTDMLATKHQKKAVFSRARHDLFQQGISKAGHRMFIQMAHFKMLCMLISLHRSW